MTTVALLAEEALLAPGLAQKEPDQSPLSIYGRRESESESE